MKISRNNKMKHLPILTGNPTTGILKVLFYYHFHISQCNLHKNSRAVKNGAALKNLGENVVKLNTAQLEAYTDIYKTVIFRRIRRIYIYVPLCVGSSKAPPMP